MGSLKYSDLPLKDRKTLDFNLTLAEQRNTCRILNTADYCHRTALQVSLVCLPDDLDLTWNIARGKDEREGGQRIRRQDFNAARIGAVPQVLIFYSLKSGFSSLGSVISTSIGILLRELEQQTEPYFTSMLKVTWANIETVTGQMSYVLELARVVDAYVEIIKTTIEQKKYLRNFYDKVSRYADYWLHALFHHLYSSSLLITKFTNSLVRSRPLRDTGAEQVSI
jgi:vacuolar protein sorting-associated protein 53